MGLYDEFFELIKSKFPRTNEGMTGGLAAELLLIISLIILCLLFRHINVHHLYYYQHFVKVFL